MKQLKILFLISLVLVLSCEKDIQVEIPSFDQKLVANCWFTGNGNWYLKVTKTRYILDDGPIEIADKAEVTIYEEDSLIETLPYIGEGVYGISNGYIAKVGKAYNLMVKSEGYPTLKANEILLEKPSVLNIDVDHTNRIVNNNLIGYYTNIYFNDTPDSDDFYLLLVYRDFITPTPTVINGINYNQGDTVFDDFVHYHVNGIIDNQICHISGWFIEDEYFKNSNNQLQLLIDQNSFENAICFNFEIYKVTENYYYYGKTVGNFAKGGLLELNGIAFGYSEPVQIKSNIVNGYGIFASYNGNVFNRKID